jgi:hypothetical protein
MQDETEDARRERIAEINAEAAEREIEDEARQRLEAKYGQVWSTSELRRDFDVIDFLAPFVRVTRKSDKVRGLLEFQHDPRFYFAFTHD